MTYLLYSILIILIYVYSGLGLTLLLCPAALRRYVLFLSPLIGYCYLTLVGWWCYRFNLAGTDAYALALMVPPFLFLFYALFRNRKQSDPDSNRVFHPELITPLVIGILTFLMISVPLLTRTKELTAVSLGNNDIASYSAVARFVKGFARSDETGYMGQGGPIKWLAEETVFGAVFASAFASSLVSLETYQVQNITLHVFFLFSLLVLYVSARKIFQYSHYGANGITALYGLSPIIYYTVYQGFEAQIIATGLALGIILINVQAVNDCLSYRDYVPYLPFAVLLIWGMVITYPHMLPFVYVPVVAYVFLLGLYTRSIKKVLNWVLFLIGSLIVVVALWPPRAQTLLTYFLNMAAAEAGWFIPLVSPEGWYGILVANLAVSPDPFPLRLVISSILLILFAWGFIKTYRKDKKLFLLSTSSTLPILAGYFLLAHLGRLENHMGGYKSYKLLTFFLPLLLLGLSIVFHDVNPAHRTPIAYVLSAILLILVGWNVVSSYRTVDLITVTHKKVGQDLIDLQRLESYPEIQSINIVSTGDWWPIMWQANFLLRKKLFFKTGSYYPASPLDGDWTLKSVTEPQNDIIKISGFEEHNTIPVNESYVLERSPALSAQLGEGWYGSEGDHTWMGGKRRSASVILYSTANSLAVDISLLYSALDPRNSLDVYSNGKKIAGCSGKKCVIKGAVLLWGKNELELRPSLPAVRPGVIIPGNQDMRELSFSFEGIEITKAQPTT